MKVMVVVGTRPEAIKMAPVIRELGRRPDMTCLTCATAQHRRMLDQVLELFDIRADADLDLMRPGQNLNEISARLFERFDALLAEARPDVVLTHGDTTTACMASLAAFHRAIPVGHVEAGLRTYDLSRPFPEEMNRRVIDLVASYLFAPTESSRENLLTERLPAGRILVTGNTVVDALRAILATIEETPDLAREIAAGLPAGIGSRPLVLITGHRRESFGAGFERICEAIKTLASRHDADFVYPVHLNPNVEGPVNRILGAAPNVHLIAPLDYRTFVYLLDKAQVVVTDSGGVQEEAVSLGKPVLVMRDVTERPEGVSHGLAVLVGTDAERIVSAFEEAFAAAPRRDASASSLYGDGEAARRIVDALQEWVPQR